MRTERALARVAVVESLREIPKAHRIEAARVGGWTVVVGKGVFKPGDQAVYFEIDSFLPDGNPAWQDLVESHPKFYKGARGHALRTAKLRGQVSQGLLLRPEDLGLTLEGALAAGADLAAAVGVSKYEEELHESLAGVARGSLPTAIPRSKQERIQNLAAELSEWQARGDAGELTWEATEKLEGESMTCARIGGQMRVCSHRLDYFEADDNIYWQAARALGVEAALAAEFGSRDCAVQGELVGPGVLKNPYGLPERRFYVYDIYELSEGRRLRPKERREAAARMGLPHVPVLEESGVVGSALDMDALVEGADGRSALSPSKRREGVVRKCEQEDLSFKSISNEYLLLGAAADPKPFKARKPGP